MKKRTPSIELFESRLLLTGNSYSRGGGLPEQSYVARDNSRSTAREVGSFDDEPISFEGEYVGRFDQRDVYTFTMEEASNVTIELDGLTDEADVYLLGKGRIPIDSSMLDGTQSETITAELEEGTYFVLVHAASNRSRATYDITFSHTAEVTPPPEDPGDSFETARELGTVDGELLIENFVGQDDLADIFSFEITTPSAFHADLTGLTDDIDLYLYDMDANELAYSTTSDPSEHIGGELAAGSYYLVVAPYYTASSDYQLALTVEASEGSSEPTGEFQPLEEVDFWGTARKSWGVNAVNAPEAWAAGYDGSGITVAIVDSGVKTDHPDLQHSIWVNPGEIAGDGIDNDNNGFIDDIGGWDFVSRDNSPYDNQNGHGTHVAGIVAAAYNNDEVTGVAHGAQIMPIRVLDYDGGGYLPDITDGIRYAVDNGAQIINLSLGGGGYSASIFAALEYAQENNVLVVSSSGNDGYAEPGYPASHSADLDNVLSVGASTRAGNIDPDSNGVGNSRAIQVDAPGLKIYSTYTDDSFKYLSGTSMAAPYVSGVAALVWAAKPELSAAEVRNAITQSISTPVTNSDALGSVDAAAAIPLALSGIPSTFTPFAASNIPDSNAASEAYYNALAHSAMAYRPALLETPSARSQSDSQTKAQIAEMILSQSRSIMPLDIAVSQATEELVLESASLEVAPIDSAFADCDLADQLAA